ncbi:hypothetical protein F5879DRAFT_1019882 [Lentinula edodes]|nr:hypothetical protein F5879DRAFT_1019882 [Lentinula edodes]
MNDQQLHRYFQQLHANNTYLGRHDNALPGPGSFFYNDSMYIWSHPLQPGRERPMPMVLHIVGRLSNQGNFTSLTGSVNALLNSPAGSDKLRVKSMRRTALVGRARAGAFPQDWEPALTKVKLLQKVLTRSESEPTRYLWFNEGGGLADTHMKVGTPCFRPRAYGEQSDGCLTDLIPGKDRSDPRWVEASQALAVADFNAIDHTGTTLPEPLLPHVLSGATVDIAFTLRGWKFGRDTLWGFTADIKQIVLLRPEQVEPIYQGITPPRATRHPLPSIPISSAQNGDSYSNYAMHHGDPTPATPNTFIQAHHANANGTSDMLSVLGPTDAPTHRSPYRGQISLDGNGSRSNIGQPSDLMLRNPTYTTFNPLESSFLGPHATNDNPFNQQVLLQEADYMTAMSLPTPISPGKYLLTLLSDKTITPNFDWEEPDPSNHSPISTQGSNLDDTPKDKPTSDTSNSGDPNGNTSSSSESVNLTGKGKKRAIPDDIAFRTTSAKTPRLDNVQGASAK